MQGSLLLTLAGLIGFSFMQTRAATGAPTPLNAPPALAKAIQFNLGIIAMDLLSYMGDHDPDHLTGLKTAGKEIKELLKTYDENPAARSAKVFDEQYEMLRSATVALLEADASENDERLALAQSSQNLSAMFKDAIRPTLRPNQLSAYARLQAVAQAEAEARALGSQTADGNRFDRAMGMFREFTRTLRGRRTSDEAERLFKEGQSHNRAIQEAEKRKHEALLQFSEAYRAFSESLNNVAHTTSGDPVLWAPSHGFLLPGLRPWAAAIGLVFFMTFYFGQWTRGSTHRSVRSLTQAVEAAATGDLSRTHDLTLSGDLGKLATALKRLLGVLGRSENLVYHLAALVESSGDAIIGQSLDGKILSWNNGAQRIYGYSADEVKGKSLILLAPESGAELADIFQRLRRHERVAPFDMLHRAKSGRRVKAFVRVGPILDSTRQIIGVSFCAQEIPDTATIVPGADARLDAPFAPSEPPK